MKQLFLTLKKKEVIFSFMVFFFFLVGKQSEREPEGRKRWVNSFSNGVLICGGNLQRAAPRLHELG